MKHYIKVQISAHDMMGNTLYKQAYVDYMSDKKFTLLNIKTHTDQFKYHIKNAISAIRQDKT